MPGVALILGEIGGGENGKTVPKKNVPETAVASSKLTRARNAVLGNSCTLLQCGKARLLEDKPYACPARREAQYATHVPSLPFSRVFLNAISRML